MKKHLLTVDRRVRHFSMNESFGQVGPGVSKKRLASTAVKSAGKRKWCQHLLPRRTKWWVVRIGLESVNSQKSVLVLRYLTIHIISVSFGYRPEAHDTSNADADVYNQRRYPKTNRVAYNIPTRKIALRPSLFLVESFKFQTTVIGRTSIKKSIIVFGIAVATRMSFMLWHWSSKVPNVQKALMGWHWNSDIMSVMRHHATTKASMA